MQKHAASRLHYDLRLEHDGILLSWAVPSGISLDHEVKRFAVHTEDHPLEYADFEGIIPAGEYGGGEMIVWDKGVLTWDEEPDAGFAKGKLLFSKFVEFISVERIRDAWLGLRLPARRRYQAELTVGVVVPCVVMDLGANSDGAIVG